MKHHYSILVTGKVQGVYYRASARTKAESLKITGFAQNQRDGSVLIEAEGEESTLQELVSWCKTGPPRAMVKDVVVTEQRTVGYLSFTIK